MKRSVWRSWRSLVVGIGALWLLAGCQWVAATGGGAALGEPVTLTPGQGAQYQVADTGEAIAVQFLQVLADDRCPTDVTCEWEGEARLQVAVQVGELPRRTFEMSTYAYSGEDWLRYAGFAIRLQEVAPYPQKQGEQIAADDYRVTLLVEPAPAAPARVAPDEPFYLRPGETATIEDGPAAVTWTRLVGDSRCPRLVQCVWRGEAKLAVEITSVMGRPLPAELSTNEAGGIRAVETSPYHIELMDVLPYPDSPDAPLQAEEYAARFVVRRTQ